MNFTKAGSKTRTNGSAARVPGKSGGTTQLVSEPRKVDSGAWIMDAGLLHSMRDEGYVFNPSTGGWGRDPNYVEPPEEPSMPF